MAFKSTASEKWMGQKRGHAAWKGREVGQPNKCEEPMVDCMEWRPAVERRRWKTDGGKREGIRVRDEGWRRGKKEMREEG